MSRNIRFATVEALPNRKIETLANGIKAVATIYKRASFKITTALMDGEFEPMQGKLADLGIALNETGRDEHVGDIERFNRTLQERMRATCNTLPFNNIPPQLVIEMAKHAIYWINSFPHPNGVSDNISPRTIITGQTVDFNRHCKYEFGQYVQTHEEHDNSMAPRTIGALALRPTGNAQGNYYFFSLSTGRILNRVHATKLSMPDDVIERVHAMARRQKANPGLVFLDRNQVPDVDDDDSDADDSDYAPDSDDDDSDDGTDFDDSDAYSEYDNDSDYTPPPDDNEEDDDNNLDYDSDDGSDDEPK
jgi:hypothetical protein